eukprot:c39968_g1_i1 orf=208-429(-)
MGERIFVPQFAPLLVTLERMVLVRRIVHTLTLVLDFWNRRVDHLEGMDRHTSSIDKDTRNHTRGVVPLVAHNT